VRTIPSNPKLETPEKRSEIDQSRLRFDQSHLLKRFLLPHAATRWSTTLSSKVKFPHTIHVRALCGANLVTLRSKCRANETRVARRVVRAPKTETRTPILGSFRGGPVLHNRLRAPTPPETPHHNAPPLRARSLVLSRSISLARSLTLSLSLALSPAPSPARSLSLARSLCSLAGINQHLSGAAWTGAQRGRPLSSEVGTYKTVKARFWPWLSGESFF